MKRIAVCLTAFTAVALAAAFSNSADEPAKDKDKSVTFSEVKYEDLDKAVTDRKGKVVLIDFWATWCGPCVKKFPNFVAADKKYAPKGLVCMSVSMDPKGKDDKYDKDEVLKFLKGKDATFINFVLLNYTKDDAKVEKRFGLDGGIPFMVMFDKTGKRAWTSEDWAEKDYTTEKFYAELDKLIEAELAK